MVQDVKEILAYMHKSTYSMEHFDKARKSLNISRGLTRIGETRFSTYVSAVSSVKRCLPAFEKIAGDPLLVIDIAVRSSL